MTRDSENKARTAGQGRWPERLALFFVAFVFWLILVWPFSQLDGRILVGDIVTGLAVATFVALIMRDMFRGRITRALQPRRWFWLAVYAFVFAWYAIRGGVDVAYRVLHPAMPIKPGIVRIPSTLRTDTGRSLLANSITLMPGTLTVDVTDDGTFYVHWLYIRSDDEEEIAEVVLRRFEWFIRRVFE